jgi:hypothetical protein
MCSPVCGTDGSPPPDSCTMYRPTQLISDQRPCLASTVSQSAGIVSVSWRSVRDHTEMMAITSAGSEQTLDRGAESRKAREGAVEPDGEEE